MPKFPLKPSLPSACLIAFAFLLGACAPDPRNHYVKTAEAKVGAAPLIPAVNLAETRGELLIALRGEHRSVSRLGFPIKAVAETDPDPGGTSFRSRYNVHQEQYGVGFEMQGSPHPRIDWFATAGANAASDIRGAMLVGAGFAVPFPWLNVRVAPAIGLHTYTNRVVDSTIVHRPAFLWNDEYQDTIVYHQENKRPVPGLLRAISVSFWPAFSAGRSWTPYLQYQAHWVGMNSSDSDNTAPSKVLDLRAHTLAAGLDIEVGKTFTLNTRVAREFLSNHFGSDDYLRVESGIGIRLAPERRRR